jgi:hypothetical protein
MVTTLEILGQASPAASTNVVLYTVPAATEADAVLNICNTTSYPAKVNIAVTVTGGTLGAKDYLLYEKEVASNDNLSLGNIKLPTGAFITIKASRAGISFNLLGSEIA